MKYILLLSVFTLSGCATWIPAAAHKQEDGSYILSTTGNSFASVDKMKLKLEKKANSICVGSEVEYIQKPNVNFRQQKDYTTGLTTSYKVMGAQVKCSPQL